MKPIDKAKYAIIAIDSVMLAMGAFLSCPYPFYRLLRVVTCGASAFFAFNSKPDWTRWTMIAVAAIYNPFLPIKGLSKDMWCAINIATIVAYAVAAYHDYRGNTESDTSNRV